MKINQSNLQQFFLVLLITFCIQTTDVKVGFIKISEILLLILTPFLLQKTLNKYLFFFIIFFTLSLLISLIITSTLDFQILGKSKIKAPYIISIARYLELIACITVSALTLKYFCQNQSPKAIKGIVNLNINITIIIVVIYILVLLKIIPISNSVVVYENYRLRGLYFEGGPYGLMLGFIFILTYFQKKSLRLYFKRIFLVITIIFFAKSKAGTMLVIIWFLISNYELFKNKIKNYKYPIIVVLFIVLYFSVINIGSMYFKELDKIRTSVRERQEDPYLILGRVSGLYIVPKIIEKNPILGIGIGNYPLIRNNKEYRTFFPVPPKKMIDIDSHGLGGIVDIIVDMGLLGFIFFLTIIILLFKALKKQRKNGKILLVSYVFLYIFGVQLTFLYPWIFLGIIIAYKNNYINEISY